VKKLLDLKNLKDITKGYMPIWPKDICLFGLRNTQAVLIGPWFL
jgi:hypothetical protein